MPVEQVELDDLIAVTELNVYGPLLAMQAVVPIMRRQGGGRDRQRQLGDDPHGPARRRPLRGHEVGAEHALAGGPRGIGRRRHRGLAGVPRGDRRPSSTRPCAPAASPGWATRARPRGPSRTAPTTSPWPSPGPSARARPRSSSPTDPSGPTRCADRRGAGDRRSPAIDPASGRRRREAAPLLLRCP